MCQISARLKSPGDFLRHMSILLSVDRGARCGTYIGLVRYKYTNEPYHIVINQYYGSSDHTMTNAQQSFHLLVIVLAGRLDRHRQAYIDYLIEENGVLKDQPEGQAVSVH
jgi:hypothetical protein